MSCNPCGRLRCLGSLFIIGHAVKLDSQVASPMNRSPNRADWQVP